MVQKTITLEEYAWRMVKVLASSDVMFNTDGESKKCREHLLASEAKMFVKNFGKEVAEKMNKAFDVEIEAKEDQEYYKVLVIFFSRIGSDITHQFLGYVSLAMKEKDEG